MGIENVQELDFKEKESLVKNIANKVSEKFEKYGIDYSKVFLKLINTNMYLADFVKNSEKAAYIYKDASLYFDRKLDLQEINNEILRVAIQRLQEVRGNNKKIRQIGLCKLDGIRSTATALNEAAIDYVLYKLQDIEEESVFAYGITLNSVSKSYPTITNIVRQMVFFTGEESLVQSTVDGNNNFKKDFSKSFDRGLYNYIVKNTDIIYRDKNNIIDYNNKILFNKKTKEVKKKDLRNRIEFNAREIQAEYVKVQRELCVSYFDKKLKASTKVEEIEELKEKMKQFKNLLGVSENPADNFFDKYSLDFYYTAENKQETIIKNSTALVVGKKSKMPKAKNAIKATQKLTSVANAESESQKE